MTPPVAGPRRGNARGNAEGNELFTRTLGGVSTKCRGACPQPPIRVPLFSFGFFVLDRTTRAAPAERGETGATPPF